MASERNNGILIGGKRPEYVHSAQGTGGASSASRPGLLRAGLWFR